MLQNEPQTRTTVDSKTAEEALALALRLQQEKGDRVSIEELHRTADEAGIDREYLDSALKHMAHKEEQAEVVSQYQRPRVFAMAVGMAVAVFIVMIARTAPEVAESPAFFASFALFALLGRKAMKGRMRDGTRRRFRDRF